jgi:hypothetical protein
LIRSGRLSSFVSEVDPRRADLTFANGERGARVSSPGDSPTTSKPPGKLSTSKVSQLIVAWKPRARRSSNSLAQISV